MTFVVIHLPLLTKSGLSVAAMSHEPCSTPSSQTRKIEVFDVCHGMRRNAKGSEELLEAGPESGTGSLPQPLFWAEVLKSDRCLSLRCEALHEGHHPASMQGGGERMHWDIQDLEL